MTLLFVTKSALYSHFHCITFAYLSLFVQRKELTVPREDVLNGSSHGALLPFVDVHTKQPIASTVPVQSEKVLQRVYSSVKSSLLPSKRLYSFESQVKFLPDLSASQKRCIFAFV